MKDQVENAVITLLRNVLGETAGKSIDATSALLGAVSELDSMTVVALLTGIETHFDISVADDEVDGATFASVPSLVEFVRAKLAA